MPNEFESKEASGGLTFKIYRGEGAALLAFDLDEESATNDFVGFSVEGEVSGINKVGRTSQPIAL